MDLADEEYETQYFGFPPTALIDGIYNAVFIYVHDAIDTVTTYVKTKYSDIMKPEEVDSGSKNLKKIMAELISKVIDKLEVYLRRNVLTIPPDLVLPEDKVHIERQFTEEDDARLDAEITQLKHQIRVANYAIAALNRTIEEQAVVETNMKIILNNFSNIKHVYDGHIERPVSVMHKVKELVMVMDEVTAHERLIEQ